MSDNDKPKKYARTVYKSASLAHVLRRLRQHFEAQRDQNPLVIPYVLTCAAYLESKLNDSLREFSIERYGEDVAAALMSLSLPRKLSVLVPILTEGRYRINTEHFVYQRLASLVRVRNSIAHAKSETEEITATPEQLITVPVLFSMQRIQVPSQFMGEADITLGTSKTFSPLQYHDALEKLEKWFFSRYPDKLSKVAMVVERPIEKQSKNVGRHGEK
jgi:hypothetical protein